GRFRQPPRVEPGPRLALLLTGANCPRVSKGGARRLFVLTDPTSSISIRSDPPMTLTNTNPPRKSLADQINRLDSLLDGLADNLNEAVASAVQQAVAAAVKEAVTSGVQQAIVEVLTNPEVQQLLRPTPPVPDPAPPEATGGGGFLGRLWRAVRGTAQRVIQSAGRAARAVGGWLAATARKARDLAAGGVQKVRRGACTLYARLMSSSI